MKQIEMEQENNEQNLPVIVPYNRTPFTISEEIKQAFKEAVMGQNNKLPESTGSSFKLSLSKKDSAFEEKETFELGIDWDFVDRSIPSRSIKGGFVYNIIFLSDRMKKHILNYETEQ